MSQEDKKEIAKAKFIVGESIQSIADGINVSRRTIERWANEGSWRSLREKNTTNVVQLQTKPKNKLGGQKLREAARRRDTIESVDDLHAIESAIAELHLSLPGAEDKAKGGIAGAIARLIELKRKLKPETVADLVERAIELEIGPDEFLTELKNAWQRRA